jgi:DNA replication protein DnaC
VKSECQKYLQGKCNDNSFCVKLFKLEQLYNLGLFSDVQRKHLDLRIDSDGTDRQQFEMLKNIEDSIVSFVTQGKNLYLYSLNCGNGKTSWAIRLAQAYVNKIWYKCDVSCKIMFISVPKFFISLKDNISLKNDYIQHIKDNVLDCDLVIWDDIGTKVGTEFEIENMLNIIDNRLCNGKSNIYTSNINPLQLNERVGGRLYSRIINLSTNIEFKGQDKRGL